MVEVLITFILVFVVVSVPTDNRVPAAIAPLALGFTLASGVFIAGPVAGGAVNPVRALGPMIVAGQFTSGWVYVLGPIVGGVLAALLHDRFVSDADARVATIWSRRPRARGMEELRAVRYTFHALRL